jgi:hypothetical protein
VIGIDVLVGQCVAAGMPEHVGMDLEPVRSNRFSVFDRAALAPVLASAKRGKRNPLKGDQS